MERLLKKQLQEGGGDGDGDGARGDGKSTLKRRNSDGMSVSSRGGDSTRGEEDIEDDVEGHDLVRRAVAAASAAGGGSSGTTTTPSAKKRNRPTRWGDNIDPSQERAAAAAAAAAAKSDKGRGSGSSGVGAGSTGGGRGAVGDEAARQAWAGELERDRTAEDEMDDYLSSLLL